MEEINVYDLIKILKKNIVLILVSGIVLSCMVFGYSKFIKVPMYKTSTSVIIIDQNKTITQSDIAMNQQLISTYSELIKSRRVLDRVVSELNLKDNYNELSKRVSVEAINNAEMLRISVENKNPKKAQVIANKTASVFSEEAAEIYKINNVSIIDKAIYPKGVSNNTTKRDTALGFIFGSFLCIGILFIRFYFDDTIKFSDNLENEINMPVVGKVGLNVSSKKSPMKDPDLIVNKDPKSLVSESFKSLRTNINFSSVDKKIKTILVTSSIPGEGKSFVSTSLAIAFCQTGKKVLLVDCDMRKGRQHHIFNLSNSKGLSNLLLEDYENVYKSYIKTTSVKNLSVLTRGVVPPNPSELLNSSRNKGLISFLSDHYDLIIFDGVPCNGLSDSVVMSTLVDETLIVAAESVTPKTTLENTKKTLDNVNANVMGVVLNKINMKDSGYYGKYYSYYGNER